MSAVIALRNPDGTFQPSTPLTSENIEIDPLAWSVLEDFIVDKALDYFCKLNDIQRERKDRLTELTEKRLSELAALAKEVKQ